MLDKLVCLLDKQWLAEPCCIMIVLGAYNRVKGAYNRVKVSAMYVVCLPLQLLFTITFITVVSLIVCVPIIPQDGLHYLASTSDGNIGQFPMSAVKKRTPIPMLPMPWYHSTISRLEAEKLLDRNQDGQFLFRTSQNTKGKYALAIRWVWSVVYVFVTVYPCCFSLSMSQHVVAIT